MSKYFRGRSALGQQRVNHILARYLAYLWLIKLCILPILLGWSDLALARDVGEIVSILGNAEVSRGEIWQPLQAGETVAIGEVIRTAEGSRIAIRLANGSQIKLNANSHLEFKPSSSPKELTPTENFLQKTLRLLGRVVK
jgi:hypothetical protein